DDRLIDIEQTSLLLEYLADLTEELKKPKPKKNYVDLLLDKISQFDSLTSLTERLLSYMLIQ
ncbi:MAG: hypothetical protein J0I84_06900, partial [Terrimonas sp.]|nr:hypothetical protein [Terrimonas sp.]